jgi:hypothetical protein
MTLELTCRALLGKGDDDADLTGLNDPKTPGGSRKADYLSHPLLLRSEAEQSTHVPHHPNES